MSEKCGPWGDKPEEPNDNNEGLTISCPACGEDNEINPGSSLVCLKCKKPLGGKDPYYRFGLASIAILIAFASGGTWAVTEFVETNRYSVLTEHAIIDSCVDEPMRTYLPSVRFRKLEICGCALQVAQEDFNENEYKEDSKGFFGAFEKGRKACSKSE